MEIDVVLNLYEDIQSDLQNGVIDVALSGEPTSKQFDFHYIILLSFNIFSNISFPPSIGLDLYSKAKS